MLLGAPLGERRPMAYGIVGLWILAVSWAPGITWGYWVGSGWLLDHSVSIVIDADTVAMHFFNWVFVFVEQWINRIEVNAATVRLRYCQAALPSG